MTQANSDPEVGHEGKYEVGARLVFLGYAPSEAWSAPEDGFEVGDHLEVLPRNGCGMGIDVRRGRDGRMDMVWPEEAALLPDRPAPAPRPAA